jgi:DNA-binding transcriptional LysR family regulator
MNLIDAYRYLAALEQHRHFGRAALACQITQPALSNALRVLEKELGVAIVRRGRQYEGLTAEGEQVLATAYRVLHEQELLHQALAGSATNPRGRLVIGAVPTAVPIAARFAARLVERHPGLSPQVRSLPSHEIETGLEILALDLGLGYIARLPGRPKNALQAQSQYVEHYYLLRGATNAKSGLCFGAPMPWRDAAALPMCLLSPEMHNRSIIDGVFRSLSLEVRPAIETNSVMALLVTVQSSGCTAILPGALVSTLMRQAGLEALPLVEPELRTPIGFMTASAPKPSHALLAALRLAGDADWLAEAGGHCGPLHQGRV